MRPLQLTIIMATVLLLSACQSDYDWHGKDISGLMPDLAFELTDEDGNSVTAEAYTDDVILMYFGFTYCPDICPTALAKLAAAVRKLPDAVQQRTRILFVSVDPDRDTPARLNEYTAAFDPRMIGLTGTQKQLQALTRRYRITYGYEQPNSDGNYNVSHSSAIFAFDRQQQVRLLQRDDLAVQQLYEDILQLSTL
ncbi:MAG: SCO family protein [Gammaproteobacteria bacterium]|jgi:protein SCO1/2|nr:SCO family protein [Gammaproteobacteria bacterium]